MLCKSMDWFLYDNGLRHERDKASSWHHLKAYCVLYDITYAKNFGAETLTWNLSLILRKLTIFELSVQKMPWGEDNSSFDILQTLKKYYVQKQSPRGVL